MVESVHRLADSRFTNLELRFPLVINAVDFPSLITLLNANQLTTLQLQIPFGPRPRFFVPPISRKQIRPVLPNDFATKIGATNVRWCVFIKKNGCGPSRSKSPQSWFGNGRDVL